MLSWRKHHEAVNETHATLRGVLIFRSNAVTKPRGNSVVVAFSHVSSITAATSAPLGQEMQERQGSSVLLQVDLAA